MCQVCWNKVGIIPIKIMKIWLLLSVCLLPKQFSGTRYILVLSFNCYIYIQDLGRGAGCQHNCTVLVTMTRQGVQAFTLTEQCLSPRQDDYSLWVEMLLCGISQIVFTQLHCWQYKTTTDFLCINIIMADFICPRTMFSGIPLSTDRSEFQKGVTVKVFLLQAKIAAKYFMVLFYLLSKRIGTAT